MDSYHSSQEHQAGNLSVPDLEPVKCSAQYYSSPRAQYLQLHQHQNSGNQYNQHYGGLYTTSSANFHSPSSSSAPSIQHHAQIGTDYYPLDYYEQTHSTCSGAPCRALESPASQAYYPQAAYALSAADYYAHPVPQLAAYSSPTVGAHPPQPAPYKSDFQAGEEPKPSYVTDEATPATLLETLGESRRLGGRPAPEAGAPAPGRLDPDSSVVLRRPVKTQPSRARTQRSLQAPDLALSRDHLGPLGLISRRKNATRETTAMLKNWLDEHGQNPYPTKGEKIMLSIITKMSLIQVSTWFANARRRMKKENKMFWASKQQSSSVSGTGSSSSAANRVIDTSGNPIRCYVHKRPTGGGGGGGGSSTSTSTITSSMLSGARRAGSLFCTVATSTSNTTHQGESAQDQPKASADSSSDSVRSRSAGGSADGPNSSSIGSTGSSISSNSASVSQ